MSKNSKKQTKAKETLHEKRVRAGRKGGNAHHECRGRACNQNNDE